MMMMMMMIYSGLFNGSKNNDNNINNCDNINNIKRNNKNIFEDSTLRIDFCFSPQSWTSKVRREVSFHFLNNSK